jgi:hypothetical protein
VAVRPRPAARGLRARVPRRGPGRRPVPRGGDAPFGGSAIDHIAAWHKRQYDISADDVDWEVAQIIVAAEYGWDAIAGPHRMNWKQFALARQHLAEREVGRIYREIEAQEDAMFEASARQLSR